MQITQREFWPEQAKPGHLLNKHLLAPGDKPDTRPWGGRFDAAHIPHVPTTRSGLSEGVSVSSEVRGFDTIQGKSIAQRRKGWGR